MFGAAILAGAIGTVSIPADVERRLFSTYPTWAVREGRSSATSIEAVVDPDGTVRECVVVEFVGSERLAREECAKLAQHKLRPATDAEGQPVMGLYRTYTVRFINDTRKSERDAVRSWVHQPDLTIDVAHVEGGVEMPRDIQVAVLVEPDGSLALCERIAERSENLPQALIDVACVDARKLSMAPLMGLDDHPARYVTNVYVRFQARASD